MMKSMAVFALVAGAAVVAFAQASPTAADGYRQSHYSQAKRGYRSPMRYYRNRCAYGDCVCIRQIALATASQVWWDRYQACTGS